MVQSVELLPDRRVEAWLRAQWGALVAADLPSLGHHPGPTNRPHVTLGVASLVAAEGEERLLSAVRSTAWQEAVVRPGGFVVFGPQGRSGRYVLARQVVVSRELLDLQTTVAAAWEQETGVPETARPGRWTPHLTLALRLTADQLARAVEVVSTVAPLEAEPGAPMAIRRWDGEATREWWLSPDPSW